jgi:hypothetical protein
VQLIGIPACTDRPFGYCGNDFALAKTIDPVVLRRLDELARRVGSWLHEENYVGAYGLDALLWGESVLFTEVNARFQGSSAVSAEIAQSLDVPDLFLDHLAASLGETCPDDGMSLAEWASQQAPRSHVVVHNTSGESISRHTAPLARIAGGRLAQLPPRGVTVEAGGTLGRIVRSGASTASGFELESFASDDVDSLLRAFTRSADCTVTA